MKSLANCLEQTYLRPETTLDDISAGVEACIDLGIFGICLPPFYMAAAREAIAERDLKLVSVIGFPMGFEHVGTKVEQAKKVIADGADELDMVMNIAAFKSGLLAQVEDGIERISTLCGMHDKVLKVILETSLLNQDELKQAMDICVAKEVAFVKTSTGFQGGASVEIIKQMRAYLPEHIGIKASGGIKERASAIDMLKAGASRIGSSSGFSILAEA